MYLAAQYVAHWLDPARNTLTQAWEHLYQDIVNANKLAICAPMIKWLQVVTMSTTAPNWTTRDFYV
jgi:hypothetical protein